MALQSQLHPEPMLSQPAARPTRRRHWLLILAGGLYCHWALLTNDGVYWDGWWLRAWLTSSNWNLTHEFFSAVGMPLYAHVNWLFAGLANPVPAMMVATVGCFLLDGLIIYELGWQSGWLTGAEALAVALLSTAFPVFLAGQEIIMLFFIFTHTLFLASVLAALLAMKATGLRALGWRGAALAGLFTAGANAGLLAFQGASFVFLFVCWRRHHPGSWWRGTWRFVPTHLDFLLLPAVTWWFRHSFTPQFGAYANYNQPKFKPLLWRLRFEQFLQVISSHLETAVDWVTGQPGWLILFGLLAAASWRLNPLAWRYCGGPARTRWLAAFGALALLLGILPYVAAGKSLGTDGLGSRTGLLLSLPAGLLLFTALRATLMLRAGRHRVLFWPLIGLLGLSLGREYTDAYLRERATWIQSRALVELLAEDPLVKRSAYVQLTGNHAALAAQVTYLTYGLGSALGMPLTTFASAQSPLREQLIPPAQIEHWMINVSGLLPTESLQIDPAGCQLIATSTLPPWPETPAALARRYVATQWSANPQAWLELRARLAQVECRLIRDAVPLAPGPVRPALPPSAPEQGNFVNGIGMQLVQLPAGWWAGKFEVTQVEFQQVMGENPSRFRDPTRPVECVSWHAAREFCRRLSLAEDSAGRLPPGHIYTLPTEAQWNELAAGATTTNGILSQSVQRWHTAPAGTLPANPQALHDVRGNVWEWCLDWADPPRHFRVLKGECWLTERPAATPAATRLGMRPDQVLWHAGFRCVLVPKTGLPPEHRPPQ